MSAGKMLHTGNFTHTDFKQLEETLVKLHFVCCRPFRVQFLRPSAVSGGSVQSQCCHLWSQGSQLGPEKSAAPPVAGNYINRKRKSNIIHSFIHLRYFYSASSSPLLLRGVSNTPLILCRRFTPKSHRQLRVKDLPKVPTWRLERDLNPRPFGRKVTNLPMNCLTPRLLYINIYIYIQILSSL